MSSYNTSNAIPNSAYQGNQAATINPKKQLAETDFNNNRVVLNQAELIIEEEENNLRRKSKKSNRQNANNNNRNYYGNEYGGKPQLPEPPPLKSGETYSMFHEFSKMMIKLGAKEREASRNQRQLERKEVINSIRKQAKETEKRAKNTLIGSTLQAGVTMAGAGTAGTLNASAYSKIGTARKDFAKAQANNRGVADAKAKVDDAVARAQSMASSTQSLNQVASALGQGAEAPFKLRAELASKDSLLWSAQEKTAQFAQGNEHELMDNMQRVALDAQKAMDVLNNNQKDLNSRIVIA